MLDGATATSDPIRDAPIGAVPLRAPTTGMRTAVSGRDRGPRLVADRRGPVAARARVPFAARPAGAAHPRRRLDRGLALGGITLLAITTAPAATSAVGPQPGAAVRAG